MKPAIISIFSFTILSIIFLSGCKKNDALITPEPETFFTGLLTYTKWHHSSSPFKEDLSSFPNKDKSLIYWYNWIPSETKENEIHGNSEREAQIFDVVFNPSKAGIYNTNFETTNPESKWGGIILPLDKSTQYLLRTKKTYLSFWMKIEDASDNAILNIDLGQISEDIILNNILDTEDKNGNDLVDNGEDTGIDRITDISENGNNTDPENDDYNFDLKSRDYEKINGLEGNAISIDAGRIPDSEDLNRDFYLDTRNNYFTYVIQIGKRKQEQEHQIDNSGWYKIEIGLQNYDSKIGSPDFDIMEYLRFWIIGSSSIVHLRFAEIKFSEY